MFAQSLRRCHHVVTRPCQTGVSMRATAEVKDIGVERGRSGAATPATLPRPARVLIVEDEQDVAELIRYNLVKDGFEVRLVSSGFEGLRQAREMAPDMILLDIMV